MPTKAAPATSAWRRYRFLREIAGRYWNAYGGIRELAASPYVHAASALTILLSHYWFVERWFDQALSVLPNLVGFSIAGFAIWIGWGDAAFRRILVEVHNDRKVSGFLEVSATFAHFALVQVVALLYAVTSKALAFDLDPSGILSQALATFGLAPDSPAKLTPLADGIGFFLFVYALLVTIESLLELFRIATWFEKAAPLLDPQANGDAPASVRAATQPHDASPSDKI